MIRTLNPNIIKKILGCFSDVVNGLEMAADKIETISEELRDKIDGVQVEENLPSSVMEKVEFISLKDIHQLVNSYKPQGSDGVAAALFDGKDKKGRKVKNLYLTYVKGLTLVNSKDNTLIVVSAEAVSNEIKDLFGENNVIILR